MAEPYKMPAPSKIAGAFDEAKGNFQMSRAFIASSDITAWSNISGIVGAAGYQDSGGQFYDNNGGNSSPYDAYGYSYNLRRIANYPAQYTNGDFMLSYNTTPVTFTATQALYQIGVGGDGKLYLGTQIMGDVFSALYPNAAVGASIIGVRTADPVPRAIANYGVFTYQKVQTATLYDRSGNPYGAFSADWSCYFPLHNVWRGKNAQGGKIADYGSMNMLSMALANAMGIPVYALITSAVDYSGHVLDYSLNIADTFSLFRTPTELKKAANGVQIPCAINDTNAIRNTPDPKDLPDYTPPGQPDNPTGGGDGDGDNESDSLDNDIDADIEVSPVGQGATLWAFDTNEIQLVADFIWQGHNKDIGGVTIAENNISSAWANGFYVPFDLLQKDNTSLSLENVTVAGYEMELQAFKILPSFDKKFDFGDITINEYYGSFLDYQPYTSINIYLPYIGIKPLDVQRVMGRTLNVSYRVDFSVGLCTAYLSTYDDTGSKMPFAVFSGQIGIPIRVSASDSASEQAVIQFATNAVTATGAAIATIATGGAALPATAGIVSTAISDGINVALQQPEPLELGTSGAECWLNSPQQCYLMIQRAQTATPKDYISLNGAISRYCGKVSEFTGFLQVSQINCTVNCTENERSMIETELKRGIYI